MLNTAGRRRRSAAISQLYGMTELSRPTAAPSARIRGSSRVAAAGADRRRASAARWPPRSRPRARRGPASADRSARSAGCTPPSWRRRAARTGRPAALSAARARSPSSATPSPARTTQSRSRAPARADHREGQRPDELDGDRDAERDPGERLVDRPVHEPEGGAERERRPASPARSAPRSTGRAIAEQHQRRWSASRSHTIAVGSISSKRSLAIAGAELHREDADQHQPDGARMTLPRRWTGVVCEEHGIAGRPPMNPSGRPVTTRATGE